MSCLGFYSSVDRSQYIVQDTSRGTVKKKERNDPSNSDVRQIRELHCGTSTSYVFHFHLAPQISKK